jgi:seryl-tRNA(Sec) selenium transferase
MTAEHSGRIINAAATLTKLGGSIMAATTVAAMTDAAARFVDLVEAMDTAGARIARLTHNEAARVTSGASSALTLAVAGLVTGPEPDDLEIFPHLTGVTRTEVVMLAPQRNAYDYAVRMLGLTIVDVDATAAALDAAMSDRTCAILWFAGTQHPAPGLDLTEIAAIAHRRDVPVIVDAAAQIPPVDMLWHYTRDVGVDAVIFSGGKGLRGPQSTGLLLGRADIIAGARANAAPNMGIGRSMKVGKEELAAIVAAVESAVGVDQAELLAGYERVVDRWIAALQGISGVDAERAFPSEAGQPHSRVTVHLDPGRGVTAGKLERALWAADPRIAVLVLDEHTIAMNPQTVAPDDETLVAAGMVRALNELGFG